MNVHTFGSLGTNNVRDIHLHSQTLIWLHIAFTTAFKNFTNFPLITSSSNFNVPTDDDPIRIKQNLRALASLQHLGCRFFSFSVFLFFVLGSRVLKFLGMIEKNQISISCQDLTSKCATRCHFSKMAPEPTHGIYRYILRTYIRYPGPQVLTSSPHTENSSKTQKRYY